MIVNKRKPSHYRPMLKHLTLKCLIPLTLMSGSTLINSVFAHHGTVVSRPNSPTLNQSSFGRQRALDWIIASTASFSQWHSQSPSDSIYSELDLGTLQMYQISLSLSYHFTDQLKSTLNLPFSLLIPSTTASSSADQPTQNQSIYGLGDLSFNVDYALAQSKSSASQSTARDWEYSWRFSVGTLVPSGAYRRETILTDSQLNASTDGSIELSSFSSQTSLGADVWQLLVGSSFSVKLSPLWSSFTQIEMNLPLENTRDGIQWGADINLRSVQNYTLTNRLALFSGVLLQLHQPDQIAVAEGSKQMVNIGGYQQLFIPFGLEAQLKPTRRCRLQFDLPVWQNIRVPQLLKTFGLSIGC